MNKINALKLIALSMSLLLILAFPCFSRAEVKTNIVSSWDFWHLHPFKEKYHNQFFLSGSSTAAVHSSADYNMAVLYFGVSSSRDGNFNFINKNELLFYGSLYLDVNLKNNDKISLGFRPGDLTRTAIFAQRNYGLGIPLLPLYANYNSTPNRVIFDGSYMQYNNAFAINYNKKAFLGTTNLNINYIPKLDFNLSNGDSFYNKLHKNLGAADASLNYYNEYQDVGYGIIGAGRLYAKNGANPKGAEFYITPNVDYLGFGVALSFLGGFIKGDENSFKYQLSEASVYYSILKFNVIATYGYNSVNGGKNYGNYYYSNASLGFSYLVNSRFALKAAIFSNKAEHYSTNQGLALGFNINV